MKKRMIQLSALMLILCLLFLAGCGSSGTAGNSGGSSGSNENGHDISKIVRNSGTLPMNQDPHIGTGTIDTICYFNVYDTLIWIEANSEIVPHLAKSWDISDDGLTYTFHLRDDVKFHDGSILNADDVVFSFERMMTLGRSFAYLFTGYVESATAVDDTTVEVKLSAPLGSFISTLLRLPIVNKDLVMENIEDGSYGEYGDYGVNFLSTSGMDAGSGPYTIIEVATNEYVMTEKFDDYFLGFGENSPDFFQMVAVEDSATMRTLFASGDLDISDEWQSQESLDALDAIPGVDIAKINAGQSLGIDFNCQKEPMDDIHFRRALAYLMDYESVITNIVPGNKQLYGQVSSAYTGSSTNLMQYEYNLDKAKEELAQSKYADTYQNYALTLWYADTAPLQEKVALLMQQAAAELGITVNLQTVTWAAQAAAAAKWEEVPEMTIFQPGGDYNEACAILYNRYHSNSVTSSNTYTFLLDPVFDEMLDNAMSIVDDNERFAAYEEVEAYIVDISPQIFICEMPEQRAYRSEYISWPEAEAAAAGEATPAVYGRSVYARTMEILK